MCFFKVRGDSKKFLTLVGHGDDCLALLNVLGKANKLKEFSEVVSHYLNFQDVLKCDEVFNGRTSLSKGPAYNVLTGQELPAGVHHAETDARVLSEAFWCYTKGGFYNLVS